MLSHWYNEQEINSGELVDIVKHRVTDKGKTKSQWWENEQNETLWTQGIFMKGIYCSKHGHYKCKGIKRKNLAILE